MSSKRPLVFAHRGGGALAPENTLAAFENGLALGADGIELDLQLSKDGVVVVSHDAMLDRTTDASGPIASRTADELAQVDAGARFAGDGSYPYRRRGVGVPRFSEVLVRHPQARMIVELKTDEISLAKAVLSEVQHAGAADRVTVGAFGCAGIQVIRDRDPRIATGACLEEVRWALYRSWLGLAPSRPQYRAFQVPERRGATTVVSPRFVRAAHRGGIAVHVWTVDEPEDMERLLGWGVDGLITDRPDLAVPLVERWIRSNP